MYRLAMIIGVAVLSGCLVNLAGGGTEAPFNQLETYNVVWDRTGEDSYDSMPLGNGDIGLNIWTEPNGDVLFYISKTDSWDDNGRLVKVGKIRVTLTPNPFLEKGDFRQTLKLKEGAVVVQGGLDGKAVELQVWVDANHPVIEVATQSSMPLAVTARIELWRKEPYELPSIECSDTYMDRSKPNSMHAPTIVEPDTVMTGLTDEIGWYHHNKKSVGPEITMKIQGLADYKMTDPLLNRIFGAVVRAKGGRRVDDVTLATQAAKTQQLSIHVLTAHPAQPEEWRKAINLSVAEVQAVGYEKRLAGHKQWWLDFWNRSWIYVQGTAGARPMVLLQPSRHPLRIGLSQQGQERFVGEIGRASIMKKALTEKEIGVLAGDDRSELKKADALLGCWTKAEAGKTIEELKSADTNEQITLEAWVRPEKMGGGGGRILDKTTPGGMDGFLLDSYPGNSLRLITRAGTLSAPDILTAGTWHHIAATINNKTGEVVLYHNGKKVADLAESVEDEALVVTRGYTLQRYISACAGRGHYPIKFNGSIFTVPYQGRPGDGDYRQWGPGYWWQNTRLPYFSMCTAGDDEMMKPLFNMYAGEVFELNKYRTKHYFGHGGVYYPECIYFWGAVFSESYGWTPFEARADKLQESGWHKWEWVGGLELVWLMLEYYEHTGDEAFLREKIVPVANEILAFFDNFYQTGPDGKLVMNPSQAVETWWRCTNPMPEVAGLQAVTARLLQLPENLTTAGQRESWKTLQKKIPSLPRRTVDGVEMLAPAEKFDMKQNIENPELYAVFPFRLVTFAQTTAKLGVEALHHRWDSGDSGWRQDVLFMANLGLAEEARKSLVTRARNKNRESRFPAFWGPNYDWVPDQDHGGVLLRALQVMLMQTDGKTIYLTPAWPKDWNADFKLHAPYDTTVSGTIRNGQIEGLTVMPESRRGDVVICLPKEQAGQ